MTAGWRNCYRRARPGVPAGAFGPLPDSAEIRHQLQTHKHLTLQLVWEEYRETQPDGHSCSRFCERTLAGAVTRMWRCTSSTVPPENMFVDWAGDTIPTHDPRTGEITPASVFVAVLGAGTYPFAQATLSQDLGNWVQCHVAAFDYFQGTPIRGPAAVDEEHIRRKVCALPITIIIDENVRGL